VHSYGNWISIERSVVEIFLDRFNLVASLHFKGSKLAWKGKFRGTRNTIWFQRHSTIWELSHDSKEGWISKCFQRQIRRHENVPLLSSYTSTSWPRWAAYKAARAPTGPAPMTIVFWVLFPSDIILNKSFSVEGPGERIDIDDCYKPSRYAAASEDKPTPQK